MGGWTGTVLHWLIEDSTDGIDAILPSMRTDIVLDSPDPAHKTVIDTKFNSIFSKGWYRDRTLRSGYIYQMYAYLRSQERDSDAQLNTASRMLLYPSVGVSVNEV